MPWDDGKWQGGMETAQLVPEKKEWIYLQGGLETAQLVPEKIGTIVGDPRRTWRWGQRVGAHSAGGEGYFLPPI